MTDKQQIEMDRDSLLDIHKRAVEKLDGLEGEVIAQKELVEGRSRGSEKHFDLKLEQF